MKKSIVTLCALTIIAAFAAVPLQAHCGSCGAHAEKKECAEGCKKECCASKEDKKEEAKPEAKE